MDAATHAYRNETKFNPAAQAEQSRAYAATFRALADKAYAKGQSFTGDEYARRARLCESIARDLLGEW